MNDLRTEMMQIAVGYWLSKALYAVARANVADELAGGPKPMAELARAAGVDRENLYRVLRALASVGIFAEDEAGRMMLTPKAEYLRADHPESMKHFALMVGEDLFEAWCDLYHTLETGESAVSKRFGRDFFAEIAKDLRKSQVFDRAMQEIHGSETALMLAHYDFSRFAAVLDVGGGNGSTLGGILRAHARLRGQLFDLPQVIENARAWLGRSGLLERVELLPGDFFQAVRGKADCVILRHVVHDWSDDAAARILRNARAALEPGGRLLVVEKVVTPGNEPDFVKLLDLNMMAIGGKERTKAEYAELLGAAGLRLLAVHQLPGATDIVEAAG